jgi:hypothetical protein
MIQADPKFAEVIVGNRLARGKEKELNSSTCKEKAFIGIFFNDDNWKAQQVAIESSRSFGIGDCQDDMVQARGLHASEVLSGGMICCDTFHDYLL